MKLRRSSSNDFDRALEADVRSVLRRDITPPGAPDYVRYRVEAMDGRTLPTPRGPLARWQSPGLPGPWPRFARRHMLGLRLAASFAVVATIVASAAVWKSTQMATLAAPSASAPVWSPGAMMLPQLAPNGAGFTYIDGIGLFVTADYGATWSGPRQIPAGDSAQGHLWDTGTIDFVDARRGWMTGVTNDVTGSKVTEYRTVDGGLTWSSVPITAFTEPAGGDTRWVFATEHFTDPLNGRLQVGQVVGGVQFSSCQLWLTSDGGASWTRTEDATMCSTSPRWVTTALGYATEGSLTRTIISRDGGVGWHLVTLTGQWSQFHTVMLGPDGESGITLVAAPDNCQDDRSFAVLTSTDGGATWLRSYDFRLPGRQTAPVCFPDTLSYAGPDRWTVLIDNVLWATPDGGRAWTELSRIDGADSVTWWDEQQGLVHLNTCPTVSLGTECGPSSVLLVTTDGGKTWRHPSFAVAEPGP